MAEEAKSGSRTPSHSSDEWIPNGDRGEQNRREQKLTAPSLGPNTLIEREPVEKRLAKHEQSEVDARGLDKRRRVVGQSYGPSKARQLGMYAIFLAVATAVVIGGIVLIGKLDTGVGKNVPHSAPWSKPGIRQIKPKPIP